MSHVVLMTKKTKHFELLLQICRARLRQKAQKLDFQSEFSMSKIFQSFLIFLFNEEKEFWNSLYYWNWAWFLMRPSYTDLQKRLKCAVFCLSVLLLYILKLYSTTEVMLIHISNFFKVLFTTKISLYVKSLFDLHSFFSLHVLYI